jgi:hypothetical protein
MSERLTRTQLKSMVKECLVEILQEGLGTLLSTGAMLPPPKENKTPLTPQRPRSANLDMPLSQSPSLKQAIRMESRGNPVMEDIFSDTASRTLPQMLNEESGKSRGVEHFSGDPGEVFGDKAASKWALLAFAEKKNKN